ncbi:MAG: fibrobacter succinogenes major paralogous domain-containing protein [Bacteroidales bacterium]|jgi:uncharacterized protein (TIGR02145 family)
MKTVCGLIIVGLTLMFSGCKKESGLLGGGSDFGTFVDTRDNHSYKWAHIGDQVWMGENLAYLPYVNNFPSESTTVPDYYVCDYVGNDIDEAMATVNYHVYGVLYNHGAARIDACPPGWHLPSDKEWKTLEKYLGMSNSDADATDTRSSGAVGGQIKEYGNTYWLNPNTGAINSSGFSARPAGFRDSDGGFYYTGRDAFFWTSTSYERDYWCRSVTYLGDGVYRNPHDGRTGFSIRCVKD